jgi:hypothetical protein
MRWRGTVYPVSARSVAFSHEGVQQKIQYRNGEFPEQLGARDLTFNYTIPMREDLAKGPYSKMFTIGLSQLLADCYNKSEGPLIDPVYGEFTCVPTSFTDDLDVLKRDGTDIKVEFTQSPEFLDEDPTFQPPGLSGVASAAGALEVALSKAYWAQEPSPEGMTDILSAINGTMRQGLGAINKVSAMADDLIFKLEKIETTMNTVASPQNWPARNTVRRLRDLAVRLKLTDAANPTRKITQTVTTQRSTASQLAAWYGMSLTDFLKLNKSLAGSPSVPKGKTVNVYAKG